MTFDERVQAVAKKGFTERQARFLTTVMLHTGVCVPRQYARFCGIVYGEKTRKFFAKLVRLQYASMYDCRHNRARIYHVNQRALYAAIGEADSRLRKPVTLNHAIQRLMVLDAIVEDPDLVWLGTADEKAAHLLALTRIEASGPASRQRRRGRGSHRPVLPGPPADRHSPRRPRRGRLRRHRPVAGRVPSVPRTSRRAAPGAARMDAPDRRAAAVPGHRPARETGRLEPAADAAQDRDARRVAVVLRAGCGRTPHRLAATTSTSGSTRRARRSPPLDSRRCTEPGNRTASPLSPARAPGRSATRSTPARGMSRLSNSVTDTAISPPWLPSRERTTFEFSARGVGAGRLGRSDVASICDSP